MLASSVKAVVACNATVPRVFTLVLFICKVTLFVTGCIPVDTDSSERSGSVIGVLILPRDTTEEATCVQAVLTCRYRSNHT